MKQFQPGLSPKERETIMQENAAKVENTTYQKPLSADDLSERRETLADNFIKIHQKQDDFKLVKDSFKLSMKPLLESNSVLLNEIKMKQATVSGTLYHMANYEDGMMETYDHEGYLISSRRLRPDERQANIFSLKAVNE